METEKRGGQTWYKFATPPFQDVDWQSLQVVTEQTMIDKYHIYQVEGSILRIIPIKDLGLNVMGNHALNPVLYLIRILSIFVVIIKNDLC